MPTQDRARRDQAMAMQGSGQPQDEGGEHGPVRPVQARSRIGAAQDDDFMAQDEEFDVLRGGRSGHQQEQSDNLPEDQVQQPQRHAGIMPNQRSPLVSDPGPSSGTPHDPRTGDERQETAKHEGVIATLQQPCSNGFHRPLSDPDTIADPAAPMTASTLAPTVCCGFGSEGNRSCDRRHASVDMERAERNLPGAGHLYQVVRLAPAPDLRSIGPASVPIKRHKCTPTA
jgi:hypothetical protein